MKLSSHVHALVLFIIGAIAGGAVGFSARPGVSPAAVTSTGPYMGRVVRVFDGDTVELVDGEVVRYLGVSTPESGRGEKTDCFGKSAAAKNRELVLNRIVRLESETKDREMHGPRLRMLFIGDENINLVLVREGFARATFYGTTSNWKDVFDRAEREARSNRKGMWGACRSTQGSPKGEE